MEEGEYRKLLKWGVVGAFVLVVVNYGILWPILIPDPCYYHNRETTLIFDLFFKPTSANGGHPYPTTFNFIFIILIGLILGSFLYYKIKGIRLKSPKKNGKHL